MVTDVVVEWKEASVAAAEEPGSKRNGEALPLTPDVLEKEMMSHLEHRCSETSWSSGVVLLAEVMTTWAVHRVKTKRGSSDGETELGCRSQKY